MFYVRFTYLIAVYIGFLLVCRGILHVLEADEQADRIAEEVL